MSYFEDLSKLFVNNFIGGQRHKRLSSSLLTIEQEENESLQSFITRFNRKALTMDEVPDLDNLEDLEDKNKESKGTGTSSLLILRTSSFVILNL